jgi:hypothetical protein
MTQMKKPSPVILVLAAAAIVLALFTAYRYFASSSKPPTIDLVELFPEAEKRTTMGSLEDGFAIVDAVIGGVQKQGIFAHPFSRITWKVDVPPGAVLKTDIGLREEAWTGDGDGALFRVGVSDGAAYSEQFRQQVAPLTNPGDRRWIPLTIDLSQWAGKRVDIIFNTEPGPANNAVRDAAVWGAPRIEYSAEGTR